MSLNSHLYIAIYFQNESEAGTGNAYEAAYYWKSGVEQRRQVMETEEKSGRKCIVLQPDHFWVPLLGINSHYDFIIDHAPTGSDLSTGPP